MQMLSTWTTLVCGTSVRALENTDPEDAKNQVARLVLNEDGTSGCATVRVRADNETYAGPLNWTDGYCQPDLHAWCDRMAKNLGYSLAEEGAYVIQYEDGSFNFGPSDSEKNGFPVGLAEASRYQSMQAAMDKYQDVVGPDGCGAAIVKIRDLAF